MIKELCDIPITTEGHRLAIEERFWSKVDRAGTCWFWQGAVDPRGYGRFDIHSHLYRSHRVAWILTHGAIPSGMFVCHHCDARNCVNPAHLFLGTAGDNMRDRDTKGRAAPQHGENNGSAKLNASQVREIRSRHAAGGVTGRALASEYRVSEATVYLILEGKTWRSITND